MADTISTLRPNGTPTVVGGWTFNTGGSGSVTYEACVSDDDDTSYITSPGLGDDITFDLTTVAVGALSQIHAVSLLLRVSNSTQQFAVALSDPATGRMTVAYFTPPTNSTTTYTLLTATLNPNGGAWTQADLDGLQVIVNSGDNVFRVHEVYVKVAYNKAPVVSAVTIGPATTGRPTIAWTYTDSEGDPQERYQAKVFTDDVYGGGGFDPATAPTVWSSGEVVSSAAPTVVGGGLRNGDTVKAYVKAADLGSGGRYGAWAASGAVTIDVDPPAVPALTVAPDDANGRVLVAVQGRDNLLSKNQASFETNTAGWGAGANTAIARTTAQSAHRAASLSLTAAAGGDVSAYTSTPAACDGGIRHTFMASVRAAAAARTATVAVQWYDTPGGSLLQTDQLAKADVNSAWTPIVMAAVSPSAATAAVIAVTFAGCGAAEVHYVDQVSLIPGPANLANANQASAETSTAGWIADANCTLAQSTATSGQGRNALKVTATGAGNVVARTTNIGGVVAGVVYTAMAKVLLGGLPRVVTCTIAWFDSGGSLLLISSGADKTELADRYTVSVVTDVAPASATQASVRIVWTSLPAGDTHYVDAVALMPAGPGLGPAVSPIIKYAHPPAWTGGGLTATQTVTVERSADHGATWTAVRPFTAAGAALGAAFALPQPGQQLDVYDHEAPAGAVVLYRATATATDAGAALTSDTSSKEPALAAAGSWLKDPLDPTRNVELCVETGVSSTSTERQTVGEPFGRAEYTVPPATVRGEVVPLSLAFGTDAEWGAFERLRQSARVLLLQLPYGDRTGGPAEQYYVRLGPDRTVTRLTSPDMAVAQKRMVTVVARQVRPPP